VRSYIDETQAALECLTAVEQGMPGEITPEQRALLVSTYNKGVDEMNALAESFNAEVREFRAR
jgi:hypothetical protein